MARTERIEQGKQLYKYIAEHKYNKARQLLETAEPEIITVGKHQRTVFHRLCLNIAGSQPSSIKVKALFLLKKLAEIYIEDLDKENAKGTSPFNFALKKAIIEARKFKHSHHWSSLCAAAILYEAGADINDETERLLANLFKVNKKAHSYLCDRSAELFTHHTKQLKKLITQTKADAAPSKSSQTEVESKVEPVTPAASVPLHEAESKVETKAPAASVSLHEVASTLFRHSDRHARMAYVLLGETTETQPGTNKALSVH